MESESNREIAENEKPVVHRFEDLRSQGVLWLINRCVFHPRGYALALHYPEGSTREDIMAGIVEPVGWSIDGDGEEPWAFWGVEDRRIAVEAGADPAKLPEFPGDEDDAFRRVELLLASARGQAL